MQMVESNHQQIHFYLFKEHIKIHIIYHSYVFRFSSIIRELALNLAKVIFV